MTTTEQRLAEIRERRAKATQGNWQVHPENDVEFNIMTANGLFYIAETFDMSGPDDRPESEANATFIAAAPSDIDFLLRVIDAQREALEVMRLEDYD